MMRFNQVSGSAGEELVMEAVHRSTPEEQSVRLHRDLKAEIPSACLGPAICKWFLLQEAQKVHRDARRGVCGDER